MYSLIDYLFKRAKLNQKFAVKLLLLFFNYFSNYLSNLVDAHSVPRFVALITVHANSARACEYNQACLQIWAGVSSYVGFYATQAVL